MMMMMMLMKMKMMMMIIFRGYNRSGQPEGIGNYALEHLVEDVRGLVKVPPSNVLMYLSRYLPLMYHSLYSTLVTDIMFATCVNGSNFCEGVLGNVNIQCHIT